VDRDMTELERFKVRSVRRERLRRAQDGATIEVAPQAAGDAQDP
jgi:hypothetical protein